MTVQHNYGTEYSTATTGPCLRSKTKTHPVSYEAHLVSCKFYYFSVF